MRQSSGSWAARRWHHAAGSYAWGGRIRLTFQASEAAAACLSIRWPALSYSLVTATILTVTPHADILAGALNKTLAIVVGSIAGILSAFAVLPLSARYSTRYNLAASLQLYGICWSNGPRR
jgi:hypothetical protein